MKKLKIGEIIALTADKKIQSLVSSETEIHLCFCNIFAMIDKTCGKAAEHHNPNPTKEAHPEVLLLWEKFEKLLAKHGVTPPYAELASGKSDEVSVPVTLG